MAYEFRVLGRLEVIRNGETLRLVRVKPRMILALLLINANHNIGVERLVDELWADPPRSAIANLRTYLANLRQLIPDKNRLVTRPSGYELRVEEGELDFSEYERLVAAGQVALARDDYPTAASLLGTAHGLWRGTTAFEGLRGSPTLDAFSSAMETQRLSETELWAEARLRLGHDTAIIPSLRGHLAQHPLRENGWAILMKALYMEGDVTGALAAYTEARENLVNQLGVEPGPELCRVHAAILDRDALALGTPGPTAVSVPAQLPTAVRGFVGRQRELVILDEMLIRHESTDAAVAVIAGTAGVGKTALAVRWAYLAREHFPDGQLYVDLRGYDVDRPANPEDVLATFLHELGAAASGIPQDVDRRAASYRSALAGRRMLVVLDNANSVEQVRPLLPGSGSSRVIVTSRNSLAGLVARDGARRVVLDLLPREDAIALLGLLIGDRAQAAPTETEGLAHWCARLPLALRVAAELAVGRPGTSIGDLVEELADERSRLDLLDAGGDPRAAVRTVFSWSYQHLPARAARAFRLLGLHPGGDWDMYAMAALADVDQAEATSLLEILGRAHLVHTTTRGRVGMHDLLRTYAAELTQGRAAAEERQAAVGRLLEYYLATAVRALDMGFPTGETHPLTVGDGDRSGPPVDQVETARAWLALEHTNIAALVCSLGPERYAQAVRMALVLWRYLEKCGYYQEITALCEHALTLARANGDQTCEAELLSDLAGVPFHLGQYDRAADLLREALAAARASGDRRSESRILQNFGGISMDTGDFDTAIDYVSRALAIQAELGDYQHSGTSHGNLSEIYRIRKDYAEALKHCRWSVAICRWHNNGVEANHMMVNLGIIRHEMGQDRLALTYLEHALTYCRESGSRRYEGIALNALGRVRSHMGHPDQAIDCQRRAIDLFQMIGNHRWSVAAYNDLARALYQAGQREDALAYCQRALTLACAAGHLYEQARAHQTLADLHREMGNEELWRHHGEIARGQRVRLGIPD